MTAPVSTVRARLGGILKAVAGGVLRRFGARRRTMPPTLTPVAVPRLGDAPLDVLATKVMFSHLRNRQQKLGPPPSAFGHLDAPQTELLIRAMVAAAGAAGPMDEAGERGLRAALAGFGLQPSAQGFVADAMAHPAALEALLRQVRDPHVASLFYAASLAAANKYGDVSRAYLGYIAARLHLPEQTLARLHSQFGFAA